MEEDSVTSNDKSKADAAETNNGFAELNGGQDTHEIFPAINFEELTNSNSMYDENVPDPLAMENTKDTANSNSLVEPMELAQDPTNSAVEESEKAVNSTANENVCDNENITTAVNEDALANIPEANENFTSHPQDIASEVQMSLDALVTKEEPELMDYGATGETEISTGIGTIANVFTDVVKEEPSSNTRTLEKVSKTSKLKKALFNSIDRASKKIIKSVGKQARSLTSPEYLWFLIQLVPKCPNNSITDEKTQLQGIIEKRVSEVAKKTISDLLERVENFTPTEYSVLFQKLGDRRKKDTPVECIKEFNQSIMWFKTHLEVEPEYIMAKTDVFNGYTSYCSMQSMNPLKISEFVSFLRTLYPTVKERRRDSKGLKRYFYTGIKMRTVLHPPKLPKFAEDQLHNNKLLSQYMSCHDCCAFYSLLVLEKTPQIGQQKIKIKDLESLSEPSASVNELVDDVSTKGNSFVNGREKIKAKTLNVVGLDQLGQAPVKLRQVAKKSVFAKRIKKVTAKYREYTESINNALHSTSRVATLPQTSRIKREDASTSNYLDGLAKIKQKLSRFVITKLENSSKFKVLCMCCQDVFYVTENEGHDLISGQEKLRDISENPKYLSKFKRTHHPSVKRLYYRYNSIILPKNVVHYNVEPSVSINRFEVFDWYNSEINILKRKLLESALNALNSNNRRSRYELKVPTNSCNLITHTPRQVTPAHPPIYISAVRTPKITEVFIKSESKFNHGKKHQSSREPEVIEISAENKSKPMHALQPVYSRNRYTPYNRRKEADFLYFPAIDTSPNNIRLANLGTLYKCILCLMLFNTEQKLQDHEKAHIFCHKCRRALRNVEVMRQHLIKHCERNYRKRKPILKIHRVDSIPIMVKKYGKTFEFARAYYRPKPKRKYREMVRTKVEPIYAALAEEIFISDVKPDILHIPEIPPVPDQPDYNISLNMLLDVAPQNASNTDEMPVLSIASSQAYVQDEFARSSSDVLGEPPKLVPFSTTSAKKKKSNSEHTLPRAGRSVKIRIKELIELN